MARNINISKEFCRALQAFYFHKVQHYMVWTHLQCGESDCDCGATNENTTLNNIVTILDRMQYFIRSMRKKEFRFKIKRFFHSNLNQNK